MAPPRGEGGRGGQGIKKILKKKSDPPGATKQGILSYELFFEGLSAGICPAEGPRRPETSANSEYGELGL